MFSSLIHEASAVWRLAAALDSFRSKIAIEFVIVSQFFAKIDEASGNNANVFSGIDRDDFAQTVWPARMIDKTCSAAFHRRVDDQIVVHAEHVSPDSSVIVVFLTHVAEFSANDSSRVLDDQFSRLVRPPREKSSSVNCGWKNLKRISTCFDHFSKSHCQRQVCLHRWTEVLIVSQARSVRRIQERKHVLWVSFAAPALRPPAAF